MKMQINKIASLFLCICMALSMLTVASFAAETTAKLTFDAAKANRKSFSSTQQVWEQNGITFTNNKSKSTNAVADYGNPVRLYENSEVIVEYSNMMEKIVFAASSSKYATVLQTSIGTVSNATVTVSGSNVTVTFKEPVDTFTIAKLSAQTRLNSLTVTGADTGCEHVNTTTSTKPATKTEDGKIVVTCDGCDCILSTEIIPALGCVVTYKVPEGTKDSEKGVTVTLTEPNALSANYTKDYIFAGWAESEVKDTTTAPELHGAGDTVTLKDDTTFYAVYKYSEKSDDSSDSAAFVLKDISQITATDIVVVTMTYTNGTVYALNSSNGSSKSPAATIITTTNNTIDGEVADELKWNIVTSGSNYTIYPNGVTNKWLYCINDNDGVRVGTNSKTVFTIDSDSGYLKCIADDTTRFLGVYLTKPDWRCYKTTTTNIKNQILGFYVLTSGVGTTTHYTTDLDKVVKGANLEVGEDLTVNFYVADEYADGTTMTFTMNGKTTTVSKPDYNDEYGAYYFAFDGIAPNRMTEEITAELKAGDQVVGTCTTTVKDIAKTYIDDSYSPATQAFAKDLLHYGAASQKYTTEADVADSDLANYGIDSFVAKEFDSKVSEGIGLSTSDTKYFRGANVWFANKNSIIVNLQNLPENAKLLVNGEEVAFSGTSYTTEGLMATELGNLYKFTVCDAEGNELQSLTYSVNYYAFAMSEHTNAEMAKLAKALYNYGVSAVEYKNSLSQ